MTPLQYDEAVGDLVTYLQWMAEPAQNTRVRVGVWVLMFLGHAHRVRLAPECGVLERRQVAVADRRRRRRRGPAESVAQPRIATLFDFLGSLSP